MGVKVITVYAFSTESGRPDQEVRDHELAVEFYDNYVLIAHNVNSDDWEDRSFA